MKNILPNSLIFLGFGFTALLVFSNPSGLVLIFGTLFGFVLIATGTMIKGPLKKFFEPQETQESFYENY